jgi:hypothetical protein
VSTRQVFQWLHCVSMSTDNSMRNINPFGLRMQPELKAKIEAEAVKNHRSINAEITARLERTFDNSEVSAEGVAATGVDQGDQSSNQLHIQGKNGVVRVYTDDQLSAYLAEAIGMLASGFGQESQGPKPRNRFPKK